MKSRVKVSRRFLDAALSLSSASAHAAFVESIRRSTGRLWRSHVLDETVDNLHVCMWVFQEKLYKCIYMGKSGLNTYGMEVEPNFMSSLLVLGQ